MKTAIAVLFLLTQFCYTQPIDITRVLSDYIGTWETAYEVTEGIKPGTTKEILTIDGAAKNMYLHIKLTGWMEGDSVKFNWVEESFITYDFSSRTLAGFYINSNGSGSAENLKGKWDEESGSIEVKGESKNDKTTVLWEVKDGKLYKKIDWTNKENDKREKFTRVFTRSS